MKVLTLLKIISWIRRQRTVVSSPLASRPRKTVTLSQMTNVIIRFPCGCVLLLALVSLYIHTTNVVWLYDKMHEIKRFPDMKYLS